MPATHTATATATSTGLGTFQSRVELAGQTLIADEPADAGGTDSGPTPYHMLAAALATCTTMTLRAYAAQKGLEIGLVSTEATHHRAPGQTPPDRFERTITLDPRLDEAVRAKLLAIAERCPVHNTLTIGSLVVTRLADGESDT